MNNQKTRNSQEMVLTSKVATAAIWLFSSLRSAMQTTHQHGQKQTTKYVAKNFFIDYWN